MIRQITQAGVCAKEDTRFVLCCFLAIRGALLELLGNKRNVGRRAKLPPCGEKELSCFLVHFTCSIARLIVEMLTLIPALASHVSQCSRHAWRQAASRVELAAGLPMGLVSWEDVPSIG